MFRSMMNLLGSVFYAGDSSKRILRVFAQHQQQLRDDFFTRAAASGKPRGLKWKQCDWLDTYALVLDRNAVMYTFFCGVNLSFDAIEGGDMEEVEAVSMIRDGSAVFHFQNNRWGSGGRVLFNMDPQMAAKTMASGQELICTSDGL